MGKKKNQNQFKFRKRNLTAYYSETIKTKKNIAEQSQQG